MSTNRVKRGGWARKRAMQKGPNGRNICRCGCDREVPKGRWTFFGPECVHDWKLKTDPGYLRDKTFERDKGRCASCGMDTEAARKEVRKLTAYVWRSRARNVHCCKNTPPPPTTTDREIARALGFRDAGFPSPNQTWWNADHIIEVVRGGGECGLENIQTLCIACHKRKTARLARERAEERKGFTLDTSPMLL